MRVLIRMHELELALALTLALNLPSNDALYRMLASKAERCKQWTVAGAMLKRTRDASRHLPLLAARHARSEFSSEMDLFAQLSLPPAVTYRSPAETALAAGHTAAAVRCYIICGELHKALSVAIPPLLSCLGGQRPGKAVAANSQKTHAATCTRS